MPLHSDDLPDGWSDHSVARPSPARTLNVKLREWLEWFGLARLVTSALAVAIVCAGGFWLIRSPVPPPESSLPAAASASQIAVTLPPPATAPPAVAVSNTPAERVVVHVAGAVALPGVYEFAAGERVADAVHAAGGLTDDADVERINLAAPLADGSRVHLPRVGEELSMPMSAPSGAAPTGDVPAGPLDINVAEATDFEILPGIGPATAAAIVAERVRNGPFVSVADLERVPGIGPAKLAALDGLVIA